MGNNLLPKRIEAWLQQRTITDEVICEYGIAFEKSIIIPVHNEKGELLFNKYRRDPEITEGPKYRYEKGATSALYGLKTLKKSEPVVICEGELDALCLISHGIQAVSSTGGAGTFKEEWKDLLPQEVFICLDSDDAGLKGAFNIQKILPIARVMFLPEGQDVTDFFISGKTVDDFKALMTEATVYEMPPAWRHLSTKKEMSALKKKYEPTINRLVLDARELRNEWKSDKVVQYVLQLWMNEYEGLKRAIKYKQPTRGQIGPDRIAAAKEVPIDQYIKFNRDGFGQCIWHNDSKPSMYWYKKQGRVKCFSCDKLGDVIDVVQQLNGVSLTEALTIILGDDGKKK